jgi:hypothetical protein
MKRILLTLIFTFCAATIGQAAQLVWKTEKVLGAAKQLPSCDPEKDQNCPDFVPYVSQSKYGVKVYYTYHEGTRVAFSFNGKDEDGFTVSTDQVHPGGYDWGGVMRKGKFTPLYMIKRFYAYDASGAVNKARTELTVLRLLAGGKSCGIDTGSKVVTDNGAARRFAEKNFAHPACAQ